MLLLDQNIPLIKNALLWLTRYRYYFYFFLITVILDATSTCQFMSILGIQAEANPLVRLTCYEFGPILGPFLGKSFQIFAVWAFIALTPRLIHFICLITIGMNLFAVISNLYVYYSALAELRPPHLA